MRTRSALTHQETILVVQLQHPRVIGQSQNKVAEKSLSSKEEYKKTLKEKNLAGALGYLKTSRLLCCVAEHHGDIWASKNLQLSSYTAYWFGLAQRYPYQVQLFDTDTIQNVFCPVVKLENVFFLVIRT